MEIVLNGAPRELAGRHTLAELVTELALEGQRIAIEVNEEIVPRSRYPHHPLRPGDRVEVVAAIGGG